MLIKKHGQYIQFKTCCLQHFIFTLMVSCLHQQNMMEKQFNTTRVVKCSLIHFHKLFLHGIQDLKNMIIFQHGKKYVYITVGSALGIIKGETCYQSYQNTLIILVGILSFLSNCQFSKIRLQYCLMCEKKSLQYMTNIKRSVKKRERLFFD